MQLKEGFVDGSKVSFNGSLKSAPAGPELSGKLKLAGESSSRLAAAFDLGAAATESIPAILGETFSLTGALSVSGDTAGIDDITIEIGGMQIAGAVSVAFGGVPQVDVALAVNRVDRISTVLAKSDGNVAIIEKTVAALQDLEIPGRL